MSNNNRGALLVGLIVGTAVGAVAGLLVAPRKGQETRKVLQKVAAAVPDLAEDLSDTVKLQTDRIATAAVGNWSATIDRVQQSLAAGIVASQSVQNQSVVSNMNAHESNPAPSASFGGE